MMELMFFELRDALISSNHSKMMLWVFACSREVFMNLSHNWMGTDVFRYLLKTKIQRARDPSCHIDCFRHMIYFVFAVSEF